MKKTVTFTIDEEIYERWCKQCDDNQINRSARVEHYIRKELYG